MDSRQGNGGNARGGQGCLRCAAAERRRRPRAAVWLWNFGWVWKTAEERWRRPVCRMSWGDNEMCGAFPRPWR
eukprot:2145094-Pleurochrysis_carterae.AAC.1